MIVIYEWIFFTLFLSIFKLFNSLMCYELRTLCSMNNGLGISGSKMFAQALVDNYHASVAAGTPFYLKD